MLLLSFLISILQGDLQYDDAQPYEPVFPSLNNAILGEDGGKGTIKSRAVLVASVSTPANTVTK